MARITYSGLVTSIRGKVGGTVFQANAYGHTVKNSPNMVRPNTPDQQLSKVILSKAVKLWSEISQPERDSWNTFASTFPQYAKNNPSSVLSGFNVFVKWHATYLLGSGIGSPVAPNPVLAMPDIDTAVITITLVGGVLSLNHTWTLSSGSWLVNYYLSRPFPASQNFLGTQSRFVFQSLNDSGSQIITSWYLGKFGQLPQVGDQIFVEYELYNDTGGKVLARVQVRVSVS